MKTVTIDSVAYLVSESGGRTADVEVQRRVVDGTLRTDLIAAKDEFTWTFVARADTPNDDLTVAEAEDLIAAVRSADVEISGDFGSFIGRRTSIARRDVPHGDDIRRHVTITFQEV